MTTQTQIPWYVSWAIQAHGNQPYGDKPYSYHICGVADIGKQFGFTDEPTQMLLHCHDVGEDCIDPKTGVKYTREEIHKVLVAAGFPVIVADAILAISDQPGKDRDEIKAKTLPIIAAFRVNKAETGFSHERPVVVAKLCDRAFNLKEGKGTKNAKYRRYQHEHPAFVAALYDPKEVELQPLWDCVNCLAAD